VDVVVAHHVVGAPRPHGVDVVDVRGLVEVEDVVLLDRDAVPAPQADVEVVHTRDGVAGDQHVLAAHFGSLRQMLTTVHES